MKAKLGLIVQNRESKKVYEITRIHPYMREIEMKPLPNTHWDFEVPEKEFVDSVDNYVTIDGEDLIGFQITTENYIVV